MTCQTCQHQILLEQSGEWTGRQHRRMLRHLAYCPQCQAFRAGLEPALIAARAALAPPDPSPVILARILQTARHAEGFTPHPIGILRLRPVRIAAYAAALLLALGLGWYLRFPHSPSNADSWRMLEQSLALLDEAWHPPAAGASDDQRLGALARHLLELQGLSAEQVLYVWEEQETLIPQDEEHLPIRPQVHNSVERLQKKYG